METHKQTSLLIERLRTAEIDNFQEVADKYPASFELIFNALKSTRYWNDLTIETGINLCQFFTLNGERLSINEIYKFFKS